MTRETPVAAATDSIQRAQSSEPASAHRVVWAYSAFWFTIAFIPIHVYWALGGTFWLPPAALNPMYKAAVQVGNWGVAVLLAIGALIVLAMAGAVGRRVHPVLVLTPMWIGSVVCLSHAIFGFITKGLYLSGVRDAVNFPELPDVSAATAAAANHTAAVVDIAVFEPWFLIEGLLLLLVGWQFLRTPKGRRRWQMSIIVGAALIDLFGTLLVV